MGRSVCAAVVVMCDVLYDGHERGSRAAPVSPGSVSSPLSHRGSVRRRLLAAADEFAQLLLDALDRIRDRLQELHHLPDVDLTHLGHSVSRVAPISTASPHPDRLRATPRTLRARTAHPVPFRHATKGAGVGDLSGRSGASLSDPSGSPAFTAALARA
jgi:hypothetical protein